MSPKVRGILKFAVTVIYLRRSNSRVRRFFVALTLIRARGVPRKGLVATADHPIVDPERLGELEALGVMAVEMESSGVATACEAAAVPWTTFRVIGGRPDEHLTDAAIMSLLRPDGTADVARGLRLMTAHPTRIPAMVRLGRDSSMAASKAARATLGAVGWVAG
jgi:hypothetical protein